ncbi:MAG TPA: hypothetical protein PLB31_00845 [Fimbriimonadaceae bacterium]|nr:hypothetical protein [Armatimonadota bacterium]HCM73396.1 hypothetical protein [Armatimonadota bacterium]HRD32293.1 hypothetical protein [Fimbriimonadaceae bacterium]HRE93395.1 hypothetical protein [Fimbriimonadaceae bacterium]HRI72997.1 hypothetical protein [Fimbriimonadaceae bacterium]
MKSINYRPWLVALAAMLAVTAFGFIEDKPKDAKFHSEQSEAELSQQQETLKGSFDEVGVVEEDTERDAEAKFDHQSKAEDALSASDAARNRKDAEDVLKKAADREKRSPWGGWLLFIGGAAVVGGVFYAIKRTSDSPPRY